ncbi:MAG: peptidylprolyl isomerase [Chloroflexi bacterium]|nr:peptidylprolyl isomerase [Chloroflexota bacterium]
MTLVTLTGCQLIGGGAGPKQWSNPPSIRIDTNKQHTATISTTMGDIEITLMPREAPNTVNNFVFLAREGVYDSVPFHRIINGFMVQTGDPTGTGRGGPGYSIVDEPVAGSYERGTVAMANAGRPNTGGSQFFIVHGENVTLAKTYTIFGKVTSGLEVVDQIASVAVTTSATGEESVPLTDVRITKIATREQ